MVKNYSRVLKSAFYGLLLATSLSAYADGDATEPPVVKLANESTISWTDFVKGINDPSTINGGNSEAVTKADLAWQAAIDELNSLKAAVDSKQTEYDAAKKAYADANTQVTVLQGQITSLSAGTSKNPETWLAEAATSASDFDAAYKAYVNSGGVTNNENVKIWYARVGNDFSSTLYFYFGDEKPVVNGVPADDWKNGTAKEFYSYIKSDGADYLYIYCGKDEQGEYNYQKTTDGCLEVGNYGGNFKTATTNASAALQTLVNNGEYDKNKAEIAKLQAELDALIQPGTDGKTGLAKLQEAQDAAEAELNAANKAVSDQEETVSDAKTAFEEALAAYQNDALENYKNVQLTGNVTATSTILKNYDGFINGNGYVITLSGVNNLFTTFSGTLVDVAVNGTIAQGFNNSVLNSVASWNKTTGNGRFYNENGASSTFTDLGALGFAARSNFGVDFDENVLTKWTKSTMVYNITFYNNPNESTAPQYVNFDGNQFVHGNTKFEIKTNRFAKSASSDVTDLKLDNIFYGENNTCDNVVIVDRKDFYAPEKINAKNLTYERTLTAGYNAVILPFALDYSFDENISSINTFDREANDTFLFTKSGENGIPANTPALITVKKDAEVNFSTFSDIVIAATPAKQIVQLEGTTAESTSYGTFQNATREQFAGKYNSYKIYALSKGAFSPVDDKVNIPAFRMVVSTDSADPTGIKAAPRKIAIIDEKGIDITGDLVTGVESVEDDLLDLTVDGGVGEINFTSGIDFGKVDIYTIDGKVAAVANVTEGTTSVNVAKGLYIVMGKKLVVK